MNKRRLGAAVPGWVCAAAIAKVLFVDDDTIRDCTSATRKMGSRA